MANANVKAVITAEDRASGVISGVGGSFLKMAGAVGAGTLAAIALSKAFDAVVSSVKTGVKVAADLESSRQGFVTLLGSAEKADRTMQRIKEEAKKTPFEIPGLTAATQALALVTKDGDESIDILMDVGKALAAAGKGQPELDRIIANLQQIGLTGKVTEMDIRQFGMNGINILELIADEFGITTKQAAAMQDQGKITFDVLKKALANAGQEGGKFANAFTNQAGTFNQMASNMKDSWNIFLADFVKQTGIFEGLKVAMGGVTAFLSANSQTIINVFKGIFGAIRNIANFLMVPYKAAWAVVIQSWSVIKPALMEMWNTIKTELVPALKELWRTIGPQLGPALKTIGIIIGVTVVGAILALAKAITIGTRIVAGFVRVQNTVIRVMSAVLGPIFRFQSAVTSAIVAPIRTAISWITRLVSAFNRVSGTIRGALSGVQAAITAPFRAAFNWIIGQVDNVANAISKLSPDNIAGGVLNKIKDAIPGFATGTGYAPGGLAVVGEQGPELVNLPRGSQVIPHNSLKGTGGSTTINMNVNVGMYAGSPMEKRRMATELFRAFKDVAAQQGVAPTDLLNGSNGVVMR